MELPARNRFILVLALISSFAASASTDHGTDKLLDAKQVTEEIYKNCLTHGSGPIEQEVCKARRPAIEQCVEHETAAKDAKAAKVKCELLFIAPTKK